jgi:hypothetical protein
LSDKHPKRKKTTFFSCLTILQDITKKKEKERKAKLWVEGTKGDGVIGCPKERLLPRDTRSLSSSLFHFINYNRS